MTSGTHPPSPQVLCLSVWCPGSWDDCENHSLFLARQEVEEIPCRLHIQDAPSSYYG